LQTAIGLLRLLSFTYFTSPSGRKRSDLELFAETEREADVVVVVVGGRSVGLRHPAGDVVRVVEVGEVRRRMTQLDVGRVAHVTRRRRRRRRGRGPAPRSRRRRLRRHAVAAWSRLAARARRADLTTERRVHEVRRTPTTVTITANSHRPTRRQRRSPVPVCY